MLKKLGAVAALMAMGGAAWAQDHLTPTDVAEGGEIWATMTARVAYGKGAIKSSSFDLDVTAESLQFQLEAGVGIGNNLEVSASLPTQPWNDSNGDGTFGAVDVKTQAQDIGFGDMDLRVTYAIFREGTGTPQWIIGLLGTMPTGSTSEGSDEVEIGGVQVSDLRKGGLGDGVVDYGFGTGISKEMGGMTLYVIAQFVIGGTRRENGVDEDRADVVTLLAGAQIPIGVDARLDVRMGLFHKSEDVTENMGFEAKEEAHFNYLGGVDLIFGIGLGWSLVAGGSAVVVEDHEADKAAVPIPTIDGFWQGELHVGLHFDFGGKKKK